MTSGAVAAAAPTEGETLMTVVGRLTADPVLTYPAPDGAAVASFTIATARHAVNSATSRSTDAEPLLLKCSVLGDGAESIAALLACGIRVIAHGRLRQRSYEAAGDPHVGVELLLDEIGVSVMQGALDMAAPRGNAARLP
jgi:single-strand DNA-binding protein